MWPLQRSPSKHFAYYFPLPSYYCIVCPLPPYPLLPYSVHPKACYTLLLHEVEQLAPSQQTDPLLPSSKCVIMSLPSLPPSLLNCALFRVLTQRLSNSLAVFSFKAGWADPPLPTPCYCVSPPYYTLPTLDLLTSRAFERVAWLWARSAIVRARSASERKLVRAGSYHTRPENQANDFEKVYTYLCFRVLVQKPVILSC